MVFKSKLIPALPRCSSSKINTFLVKGDAIFMKLDTPFLLVVFLGMLHLSLSNIPINVVINVACRWQLKDEILEDRALLIVDQIIILLQLCLDVTYVCFWNAYYCQSFGTAMGSLVSVTVTYLMMKEIEQSALVSFDPPLHFWKGMICAWLLEQTLHPPSTTNSIVWTITFSSRKRR